MSVANRKRLIPQLAWSDKFWALPAGSQIKLHAHVRNVRNVRFLKPTQMERTMENKCDQSFIKDDLQGVRRNEFSSRQKLQHGMKAHVSHTISRHL